MTLYRYSLSAISLLYPALTLTALCSAIAITIRYNYDDAVRVHCMQAEEWFPSLSAVIGDFVPQRFIFRWLMMWTVLPRWSTILGHRQLFANAVALTTSSTSLRKRSVDLLFALELIRMGSALGWIQINSRDDMTLHVASFAVYMALSLVCFLMQTMLLSHAVQVALPVNEFQLRKSLRLKRVFIVAQLLYFPPMIYFYWRHKSDCEHGAYSKFNLTEWAFGFTNVFCDATAAYDLTAMQLSTAMNTDELSKTV
jgi:hypothetical protein